MLSTSLVLWYRHAVVLQDVQQLVLEGADVLANLAGNTELEQEQVGWCVGAPVNLLDVVFGYGVILRLPLFAGDVPGNDRSGAVA